MPVVRPYPIGEVSPHPLLDAQLGVPAAGEIALFGGNEARDLQFAGQQLGQTSDTLFALYERKAKEANDNRVQDLNNQFITGRREILRTAPNAYYNQQGADAVSGAGAVAEKLKTLGSQIFGQAANDYQRQKLRPILDAHLAASIDAIKSRVGEQQAVYARNVAASAIETSRADAISDPPNLPNAVLRAEGAARAYHRGQPLEVVETEARKAGSSVIAGVIADRLAHDDPSGIALLLQHGDRLDPRDRRTLEAAAGMLSNSIDAAAWVRDRSATPVAPAPTGDAALDAVNAASAAAAAPPPVVSSAGWLLDRDGVAGTRQRLAEIEDRRRALSALNEREFAANPARQRANQVAIDADTARARAAVKAEADGVYGDLRRYLTTGGPGGGPAVGLAPATLMSRLSDDLQDAVTAQIDRNIEGQPTRTDPQIWSAIRQGLTSEDATVRQRWASTNLARFTGRLSDKDVAALETLQTAVRTNDGSAGQTRLQIITRMANQALQSAGIDPTPRPDAPSGSDAAQAALFHRALQDELSARESTGRTPTTTEAYDIVKALKDTGIKSGWLEVSDRSASPTVWSDIPATDDAFHKDGVFLAQAEPPAPPDQTRGTVMRLVPDSETFRRQMDEHRQREAADQSAAATGGLPGAPATDLDPGSPEYRSADEEARRISAGEDTNASGAQRPEPVRPPTSRGANIAVPAAPALAPAGAILDKAGQAARRGASWLGSTIPVAAGIAAEVAVSALPLILIPTNSQAELHPIGENLRVRTAPGQRSATVQLRVDNGVLGTGVGANWIDLAVGAEWASDELTGRRYIAVDRRGLEEAIGSDAANAALGSNGIAMARPPKANGGEKDNPGAGHKSERFGEKLTHEPPEEDPEPPPNPDPLVRPTINRGEKPRIVDNEDIDTSPASGASEGFRSYGAFKWKYKSAGPGYEWHHIVEQTPKNVVQFGAAKIHNQYNIVRLPKWLHYKISHFYSTKQWFSEPLTVRKWLENQSFEEQAAYGRKLIEIFRGESQ